MIDKNELLNILQAEIDKHKEYAQAQKDDRTKHGWNMFINGMVEARDIIAEMENE